MKSLQFGDYYQTYDNLAALAFLYGDHKKNIDFLKNIAVRKFPQDATLWLYLAGLEYKYGDKENAKYDIQHAYYYNQSTQMALIYNAIMNNQKIGTIIQKQ